MARKQVASTSNVMAEPPGKVPGGEQVPGQAPVRKKRRTKTEIAEEKMLKDLAGTPTPKPMGGRTPVQMPTMSGVVDLTAKKAEPDTLMAFEDVALIAELEGVPLLTYIHQTLQGTDQAKRIKENLDGLRKAIDDFLANSGAPGFVFVDEAADGRVFSFRRVTTERETLDAVLLLQNGVPADVIERSKRKTTTTALTIREIKG